MARLFQYPRVAAPATDQSVVSGEQTLDRWYRPTEVPQSRWTALRRFSLAALVAVTVFVPADQTGKPVEAWAYPAQMPVRRAVRPLLGGALLVPQDFAAAPVPPLDSWYRQTEKPYLVRRFPASLRQEPLSRSVIVIVTPETVTVDKWHPAIEQPLRRHTQRKNETLRWPFFETGRPPESAFAWIECTAPAVGWDECSTPGAIPIIPVETPAMSVKVGSFVTDAITDQVITGVGFRGKVALFWTVGTTLAQDSTFQSDQHMSIGWASSVSSATQRYALVRSLDAKSPPDISCRKQLGDGVFGIMETDTTIAQAGQLSSWQDDGFTITKPVNVSSGYVVYYAIFGGTDFYQSRVLEIDVDDTVPAQPYTGVGFMADLLHFFGVRGQNTASLPSPLNMDNHSTMHLAAATAPTSRWAIATSGQNAAASGAAMGAVATQRQDLAHAVLSVTGTPTLEKFANLLSIDPDGFTLDQTESGIPSAARRTAVLALKGPRFAIGKVNRMSSPNVTGLPFRPKFVMLASFHQAATTAVGGDCQIAFGATDGTNHGAIWAKLRDVTIPTNAKRYAQTGVTFVTADATPTVDATATLTITADGFSLASSPVGIIDDEICYIAIGPAVAGTIPTNPTPIFQDTTIPFLVPETAKPAYMVELVEPTFRDPDIPTPTVTRISDDPGNTAIINVLPLPAAATYAMTWGGRARHRYSKDQPWNYDETLYVMENRSSDSHLPNKHLGSPVKILLDGQTMRPKYRIGPVAEALMSEFRWHPTSAYTNTLVNVTADGKSLQWIDVLNDSITKSWDLTPAAPLGVDGFGDGEGNMSDDGRYIALFRSVDPTGVTTNDADVFVVDMSQAGAAALGPVLRVVSTDPVAQKTNRIVTWATMSPLGNFVVLHWRGEKTSVLDFNKSTMVLSERNMGAFGSGVGGDQWLSTNYAIDTHLGTPNVESAALFPSGIEGMKITGPGIPVGTIVKTWTDSSNIVLGQNCTASASITARIGDESDHGYIWRMGHGDVMTNPEDSDAEVIIGQDQRLPTGDAFNGRPISHVVMARLTDGSPTSLTHVNVSGVSEMSSHHVSTRNKRRPGWCYVSYFEKTTATLRLYQEEIASVKLLPDGATSGYEMYRYAHHHSDNSTLNGNPSNTYQAECHPVANWDGTRIIFSSDWTRECDGGCGDGHYEDVLGNIYPAGGPTWYPAGVYQDYMIETFVGSSQTWEEKTTPSTIWTEHSA